MAILLKCGGLFFHIPGTGGTWVGGALEASGLVFAHLGAQHAPPSDIEPMERLLQAAHQHGRPNRPLFKFCFVTHPQRWYEWSYRASGETGSFDAFVEKCLRERPGHVSTMYDEYTRDAHFVGRRERLAEDLQIALTFLKVSGVDSTVVGTPPAPPQELRLDRSLQQALEETEQDAYARFGYAGEGTRAAAPAPFGPIAPLPGPFVRERGFAWQVPLEGLAPFADNADYPCRSMVSLLENGMPLSGPHAAHDDVRNLGGGRFSHWNDTILFSTSDNSNPNDTGRRYDLAWVFPAPFDAADLVMRPPVAPAAVKAA